MTRTPQPSPTSHKPAVIVFGLDQTGKPKAGRFAEQHAAVARKAAKSLGLSICPSSKPGFADLANKIPSGRVHAQGKAFIPYIKRELYELVQAASKTTAALAAKSKPGASISASPNVRLPKDWNDIAEGHLVLYSEGSQEGWWPSLVVARDGDSLTIRYRDFPKIPPFQCQLRDVALMFAGAE
jgi:hypothetical protein